MITLKKLWLVLDSIVVCIFDTLLWLIGMVVLTLVVAVATTIIVPLYHGHILIKKFKEIK